MKLRRSLIILAAVACEPQTTRRPPVPDVASFAVASGATVKSVTAGDVLPVTVHATIDSGWQIYSLTQKSGGPTPLTITVAPAPPFSIDSAITGPAPRVKRDATFGIDTEIYDSAPTFVVPVRVAASATPGPRTIELIVVSQACSDKVCLPPVTTSVNVPVRIAGR